MSRRSFQPALALFLALAACPTMGGGKDTGEPLDPASVVPAVEILRPAAGDVYYEGDAVDLQARVTDEVTGRNVQADQVAWSADGWTGSTGASTSVTNFRQGDYQITATATIGGKQADDKVRITVQSATVDYQGTFQADIDISGGYDLSDVCLGNVSFTVERGATLAGQGSCELQEYGDYVDPLSFDIEGRVQGNSVSGNLVMVDDKGNEQLTPFDGTVGNGDVIDCSFDKTFRSDDGSLRLNGSFHANPS